MRKIVFLLLIILLAGCSAPVEETEPFIYCYCVTFNRL